MFFDVKHHVGFDPTPSVWKTDMQPLTPMVQTNIIKGSFESKIHGISVTFTCLEESVQRSDSRNPAFKNLEFEKLQSCHIFELCYF